MNVGLGVAGNEVTSINKVSLQSTVAEYKGRLEWRRTTTTKSTSPVFEVRRRKQNDLLNDH